MPPGYGSSDNQNKLKQMAEQFWNIPTIKKVTSNRLHGLRVGILPESREQMRYCVETQYLQSLPLARWQGAKTEGEDGFLVSRSLPSAPP